MYPHDLKDDVLEVLRWGDGTHNGVDFRVPSKFGWWRHRSIQDTEYAFTHLWPFDFDVSRPASGRFAAMSVPLTVNFDCHVVTEGYDLTQHGNLNADDPNVWYDTGGHPRFFHLERYQKSLALPEMVKGLGSGKTACYTAKKNNLMIWKPDEGTAHYQAFFTLTRPKETPDKLLLYVQSAYVKKEPYKAQRQDRRIFAGECAKLMGLI